MAPVLRDLLSHAPLELTLLTAEDALPAGALDAPVAWVHSSDLVDPTPFLDAGHVLLITGTQFDHDADDDEFDRYVRRLTAAGVTGLGFGTEVIRHGTPDALREACLRCGLPLFEVPYRIPFIQVARYAADLVAEAGYERRNWALQAQRAISLAALRPNGLAATLAELARRLGHWVALYDASGELDRAFPSGVPSERAATAVRDEVQAMLRRGRRAGSTITVDEDAFTLQTLGRADQLRGILVVAGASQLDDAGQQVVTSVIALAGLSLEQNHELSRARSHLRAGLWHAMVSGDVDLARRVVGQMWGDLPREPVRVGLIAAEQRLLEPIGEALELRIADQSGSFFHAPAGREIVVCLGPDASGLPDAVGRAFEVTIGLSGEVGYGELGRAAEQAAIALRRARGSGERMVAFSSIADEGMLAFLAAADAGEVARATLAPLVEHDSLRGTALVLSLRVWLEENGQFERAAERLGIHRHTMRARVAEAERVLGRELSAFHARADVWAALLAVGEAANPH